MTGTRFFAPLVKTVFEPARKTSAATLSRCAQHNFVSGAAVCSKDLRFSALRSRPFSSSTPVTNVSPKPQPPPGPAPGTGAGTGAAAGAAGSSSTNKMLVKTIVFAGLVVGATGSLYLSMNQQGMSFKDACNEWLKRFEEFNDASREYLEDLADKWFPLSNEPLLLDLETMKYPDYVPTLVLDLNKTIVHLEHDSRTGWRVVKRPGADRFFKELQNFYEIVIWSDDVNPVAQDVVNKWAIPVSGVIHREFCKKKRGHYIKDLSRLGRKMERVVMIDHEKEAFQLQPENGIQVREFTGDPNDRELLDLIDFLKAGASQGPGDLRDWLAKHGGGDVDVGRRYLVEKAEHDKRVEKRRSFGRAFTAGTPRSFGQQSPFGPV